MTLPQAAPGDEGPRSREHFSYQGTAPEARWFAYLAGPPMWFWVHQPKRTKPCLAVLTNRAVECPWCGTPKPVERKAYVPIYRAVDLAPRCIIVSELYEDTLNKLKLHDRIQVGKENEESDPVWVIKALSREPVFHTTLRHRFQPVDLTLSLLKIWGNDALKQWYAKTGGQSDNAVSLPTPGKPVNTWNRFVELGSAGELAGTVATDQPPATAEEEQVERERDLLRAVQRGEKPSTNGHGKKKPPKKG